MPANTQCLASAERSAADIRNDRLFSDRIGLASQRRFVNLKFSAQNNQPVSWKRLARGDFNEVTRNNFARRNSDGGPLAKDGGTRRKAFRETLG